MESFRASVESVSSSFSRLPPGQQADALALLRSALDSCEVEFRVGRLAEAVPLLTAAWAEAEVAASSWVSPADEDPLTNHLFRSLTALNAVSPTPPGDEEKPSTSGAKPLPAGEPSPEARQPGTTLGSACSRASERASQEVSSSSIALPERSSRHPDIAAPPTRCTEGAGHPSKTPNISPSDVNIQVQLKGQLCASAALQKPLPNSTASTSTNPRPFHACQSCPLRFASRRRLYCHRKSHTLPGHCSCVLCGLFLPSSHYSRHLAVRHHRGDPGPPLRRCPDCGFQTRFRQSLSRHRTRQHGKQSPRFPCPDCPVLLASPSALAEHAAYRHRRAETETKCPQCDRRFAFQRDLNKHVRFGS